MFGNSDSIFLDDINKFSYQILVKAYEPVASKKIFYLNEKNGQDHVALDEDWEVAGIDRKSVV